MTPKRVIFLIAAAVALGALAGAGEVYQIVNGPKDFYFGHISLTDIRGDGMDPVVLRDGAKEPEPASLNLPLGPGDTIRTSKDRRVEIQFDNATVVRLDTDSELKIETILAQGLSSANKMTNLVLAKGRMFIMYMQYNSRELFQVLTPKAAFKLRHSSVGMITLTPDGSTDIQMNYGKATALYGADLKTPKELPIAAKERATFTPDNRFALGQPLPVDEFESWNKTVNEDFDKLHQGKSMLPKPVQRLQPAVFYWAQRYSGRYGEWVFDDYFGYVWRPFYNDTYPWGSWRPYYAGRWSQFNGSMYWLGVEPWGWIPYHLGIWQWNAKRGWYWIPGSAFAPAWVDWAFFGGYWSWRPWSMWDWGFWNYDMMGWNGWGAWGGYTGWSYWNWRYRDMTGPFGSITAGYDITGMPIEGKNVDPRRGSLYAALNTLSGAQKAGLKTMMSDLKKGDPSLRESFLAQGQFASVVDRATLMASDVGSKSVSFDTFRAKVESLPATNSLRVLMNNTPPAGQTWAEYYAAQNTRSNEREVTAGPGGRTVERPSAPAESLGARVISRDAGSRAFKGALRTIDWNPDVRMAQRLGVQIRYMSGRNQIVCPELNLNSANSRFNPDNRSRGDGSYMGAGSASGGSSAGGGAMSAGSASSGSSAGSAGSSSGSSGSAGSGGGHIK